MFNLYWTLGIGLFCLIVGAFSGFSFEQSRYAKFRESVVIAQKVQADEAKQIEAKHQQTTKEISDAYQHDISVIRAFYAHRVPNSASSGNLPPVSTAPQGTDGTRIHAVFAPFRPSTEVECAKTTEKLNRLQEWVEKVGE
jgi:hypothetical protein